MPSDRADDLSRTVGVLLAGGRGRRLHELTERAAKAALPVGLRHRLVDFAAGRAAAAGLPHMLALVDYRPRVVSEHLRGACCMAHRCA